MSTPVTPTAARKRTFPQGTSSGDNNEGGSGWWGAIGGVVGEFLQGWGLFGALRKRSGAPGGVRSTPATPPMYSHPSSPTHEHIELRQLSFQSSQDNYSWVKCNQLHVVSQSKSSFMNPCYVRVEGSRPGEGHVFRSTTLERPAWCDACAHLVFYHATTCHNCSYTCHEQCQDLVTLDCKTDLTPDSHTSEEDLYEDTDQGTLVKHEHLSNQNLSITVTSQEEEEETAEEDSYEEQEEKHEEEQQEKELLEEPYKKHEEVSTLRKSVNRLQSHLVDNETLEAWVEKYNATTQGLQIAKENDGSYRGCIRVHLNLSRPINIVAGTRPPSIYDILQEDRTMEKTLTSFYMPRDAVKAIHITSKTTTREVIIALLRKFKVVDNPQKFALYERTYDTGQPGKAKLRRLGDSECPLVLAINWSAQGLTNKRLVLQENDTADIQWEAFSLPELSNFLRILDREEEEYRCQIKDKYALLRRRIGNMLIQNSPSE